MKRNKYDEKESLIFELERELEKLYQIKKELSWIEYDTPIKMGKKISYKLREDIARSPIGEELSKLIEDSYYPVHLKKDDFKLWIKQGKPKTLKRSSKNRFKNTDVYPVKRTYTKLDFLKSKSYLKYFEIDTKSVWRKQWKISIPEWYLDFKIDNWIITHYKEIDTDVESKIDKLEERIWSLKDRVGWWKTQSHKWYKRKLNKTNRQITKQNIKKVIEGEDEYFQNTLKKWNWWDLY